MSDRHNSAAFCKGFEDGRNGKPPSNQYWSEIDRVSYARGYATGKEVRKVNS